MFVTRKLLNRSLFEPAIRRCKSFNATGSSSEAPRSFFRLSLIGASVGAVVGTGYSIHQLNKPRSHIINEETTIAPVHEVPKISPSRQVKYANDSSGLKLILFQYQSCPFCCKVRAFLDYFGLSYDVIEVHPISRAEIKWSQYKKVPILLAKLENGYQPLNDSSMIVSTVASYLQDRNRELKQVVDSYPFISFRDEDGKTKTEIMNKYFLMLPSQKQPTLKEAEEERKWRKWTDDVLVHTLSPNVYRTIPEAIQAFTWFSESGNWDQFYSAPNRYFIIYSGAFAMWIVGKRIHKRYNLKGDVRESLYDQCNLWMKAVRQKGDFMGGDKPNLADLSVYGVLSSIEGCTAFKDLLENTKIKNWYYGTKKAVESQMGTSNTHFV